MRKAFKASRLIGLLALLAGFMAFSATVAQAEVGAYWEVGGTKIEGASELLPKIDAKKDSAHSVLTTKVGLAKVEILCVNIKFVNGLLHKLGKATGKIHYDECITKLNGVAAGACTPKSPGAALGLIETEALDGLLKLHDLGAGGKDDTLELLPVNAGMKFVTLEMGASCSIGVKFDITGTASLKDCGGNTSALENKVEHLFEEFAPLTKLFFGGNAATIAGSAWGFLAGAHAGQAFHGHPA